MHKHLSRRRTLAVGAIAATTAASALVAGPVDASRNHQDFTIRIENISNGFEYSQSGAFAHPNGGAEPGPAFPGDSYSFEVHAQPGDRLSLATMLVQSNDWFFGLPDSGIDLYGADGTPLSGDIASHFLVLDAGTEADQTPGEGQDQAPRQTGPDTGAPDPDPNVRAVNAVGQATDFISVDVTPGDDHLFTVTVTNHSETSALPTPLAPGVFVVHQADGALYTVGHPDRGDGLQGLAEDGAAGPHAEALANRTGVATPLAPVFYAATWWDRPIFTLDRPMNGLGIETLAEDGSPAVLAENYAVRPFGDIGAQPVPIGAAGPGPALPGDAYEFTVSATPTQPLHFATMFVQSNDWFFAPSQEGIVLFDESGEPISGDITSYVAIFDAGTEFDQTPGFGTDQAPRQAGPNTGALDSIGTVRQVDLDAGGYVRVTITPAD